MLIVVKLIDVKLNGSDVNKNNKNYLCCFKVTRYVPLSDYVIDYVPLPGTSCC